MFEVNSETVKKQHDAIVNFIKTWFSDKSGPAVIGISGGKDSTVCAALLVEALGADRVLGVTMPNDIQVDIEDSYKVCEILGIKHYNVNIGEAYKALNAAIPLAARVSGLNGVYTSNTPARLRMVTLYGIAAQVGGFVCNTCNLSESIVGWETYGGDGFGDFSPIGLLTVTEVLALGDYLDLPQRLVHKAPSDGMCGATDEDKFGFTYAELDDAIRNDVHGEHYGKMVQMNKRSHFKHENIHIPTANPDMHINKDFNWN